MKLFHYCVIPKSESIIYHRMQKLTRKIKYLERESDREINAGTKKPKFKLLAKGQDIIMGLRVRS